MLPKKVTFIGFGLMAGSLAKSLKKINPEIVLYAVSRTMEPMLQAKEDRVLTDAFSSINKTVLDVDLIYLCTPIKIMYNFLKEIEGKIPKDCIVTDVGSTKSELIKFVDAMDNPPCFIGGHPMTGAEKTGYESSTAHLYENAYYILTPSESSTDESVGFLKDLVKKIGAIPIQMDAHEHDMITAGISHVPHIIASALVNMVRNNDTSDGKMQLMAAGGFRDITRIASSSPEMWLSIAESNRTQICRLLESYIESIKNISNAMASLDRDTVYSFFDEARKYRDALPRSKKGLIQPTYDLIIDIEDKPGIIGEITTIIGNHNINIKNLNISNSREDEAGVFRISFIDMESLILAYEILFNLGYNVTKDI